MGLRKRTAPPPPELAPASPAVPAAVLRQIAVTAGCDPRTAKKLITGGRVGPLVAPRIVAALQQLGLEHLIPRAA